MTNPDKLPNPGSPEAVEMGCLCPTVDNGHGRGLFVDCHGEKRFVYNLSCPLHRTQGQAVLEELDDPIDSGEPQFIHDPDCPLHGVPRRKV